MQKLLGFIGMTAGGWIFWYMGEWYSLTAAILLSVVGTGVGLYVGRRIADEYF
jgi:uncharacterized membrane protein YeaQ/YmgE (transglycosylase-associated protein family)